MHGDGVAGTAIAVGPGGSTQSTGMNIRPL